MLARWSYSLWLLLAYVIVFLLWRTFPSRESFLVVGGVAVCSLAVSLRWAQRAGYFVNRVDLSLHGLVIFDLLLEAAAFEVLRLFQPYASVELFHHNSNVVGCAILFVCLVGGYRWWALRAGGERLEV